MKKEDLTPQQLVERELLVQTLTKAGWEASAFNRLFDKGHFVRCEALMNYQNATMELGVGYFASQERIYFGFHEKVSADGLESIVLRPPAGLDIAIEYDDQLEDLLQLIVSVQDQISAENYKKIVRQILRICPKAYLWREGDFGDEMIPLLLDD